MNSNAFRSALAQIPGSIANFKQLVANVPYEEKGILFSEMYFLWLLASPLKPRRILESGRARGQSTLVLSLCFPDAEIISVEYDHESPDVEIARERLQGRSNVRQLFGDATRLLPEMAQPHDVAIVDGPKGYRGVRLALTMLGKEVPLVFMHDAVYGSRERHFLGRDLPETLYSDNPEFAAQAHTLDLDVLDTIPLAQRWKPEDISSGYGYSLACIPRQPGRNYSLLAYRARYDSFMNRIFGL